jgi:hypothetical protein
MKKFPSEHLKFVFVKKFENEKYNIDDKNYLTLIFLITVVGFSIYKSYYISEQKTKYIDVNRIFANEYIKRINENKTLQKCTFLMKVKNYKIKATNILLTSIYFVFCSDI